jgi:DNA-binding response OmpR family regulator
MSKPVILVVDDDAPILTLMHNLLREFGFEARVAATGEAAIEAARAKTPDLVLVDKNMPGMHGTDVIRALRSDAGLQSVPILILSGDPVDPTELSELGANGAVQKPFDVPALIEQIRSFVGVARA